MSGATYPCPDISSYAAEFDYTPSCLHSLERTEPTFLKKNTLAFRHKTTSTGTLRNQYLTRIHYEKRSDTDYLKEKTMAFRHSRQRSTGDVTAHIFQENFHGFSPQEQRSTGNVHELLWNKKNKNHGFSPQAQRSQERFLHSPLVHIFQAPALHFPLVGSFVVLPSVHVSSTLYIPLILFYVFPFFATTRTLYIFFSPSLINFSAHTATCI